MLTSREKAEDNISRKLNSLVDKKELQQEICENSEFVVNFNGNVYMGFIIID